MCIGAQYTCYILEAYYSEILCRLATAFMFITDFSFVLFRFHSFSVIIMLLGIKRSSRNSNI